MVLVLCIQWNLNYGEQTWGISVTKQDQNVVEELDDKECWNDSDGVHYKGMQ